MKLHQLLKKLNKLDPELEIIGFDPYEEKLTNKIKIELLEHSGRETDCWHSNRTFESDIPAGMYIHIVCGN